MVVSSHKLPHELMLPKFGQKKQPKHDRHMPKMRNTKGCSESAMQFMFYGTKERR
jgi:hypothetical protein